MQAQWCCQLELSAGFLVYDISGLAREDLQQNSKASEGQVQSCSREAFNAGVHPLLERRIRPASCRCFSFFMFNFLFYQIICTISCSLFCFSLLWVKRVLNYRKKNSPLVISFITFYVTTGLLVFAYRTKLFHRQ